MAKRKATQDKATDALEFAREAAKTAKTWVELSNAIFGIGGKFGELFPTQSERVEFTKTPEYREIQELIRQLQEDGGPALIDASGKFLLRVPKSLHAALVAEAEAEGVSLNQLCLAKLSAQLRSLTH